MNLTGLHLLLTYECNYECDHCFVWSGPRQPGRMTLTGIDSIVAQADELGSIRWIYFEGGEPFLYYPLLLAGVRRAAASGFEVGIVSNGYWATDDDDAIEWLRPLAGLVDDLSLSCDEYHGGDEESAHAETAHRAAARLGIPTGLIRIAPPDAPEATPAVGQLPEAESSVMFRGRAALTLAPRAPRHPWESFTGCPHEDLRDPGRVHVDPLGHVHLCQGLTLGNLFETPLSELVARFDPDRHPIVGPLLSGGPAELARRYQIPHGERFADACELCDHARRTLRSRFPEILCPDQMYGSVETLR